jgi:hypothetical protein
LEDIRRLHCLTFRNLSLPHTSAFFYQSQFKNLGVFHSHVPAGISIDLSASFVSATELRCTVPAQVAGSFRVAASLDGKKPFS